MKTLVLGCIAAISMNYADESEIHRIAVGADVYRVGRSACFKSDEVDHHGKMSANGVVLNYHLMLPNTLYLGLGGTYHWGYLHQAFVFHNFPVKENEENMEPELIELKVQRKHTLSNKQAEARVGMNIAAMPELSLTPFVGISGRGAHVKSYDNCPYSETKTNMLEFLAGLFSEYSINEQFKSGINLKRYHSIKTAVHFNGERMHMPTCKPVWEFALPVSYHFVSSDEDRIIISIEPYMRKQFVSHADSMKGARINIACDF